MAKRRTEDVIAYKHSVSPQKASKSFHFKMETARSSGKTVKAICFDGSLRGLILDTKLSGEAIKLKRVVKQEQSKENYYADYVINTNTIIEAVDPMNMNFQPHEQEIVYSNLATELVVGTLYSFKAKLGLCYATESSVFNGKRYRTVLSNAVLFDEHGEVAFSIWDE